MRFIKSLFTRKAKPMKPSISDEICIQRLAVNEGCILEPYKCPAGKLTIGIGRNIDDNPLTAEEIAFIGHNCRKKGITEQQANYLCRNDLKRVRQQLDKYLTWWQDLNPDRQYVMIDLCFNMGINTLLTFKKTLDSIATGYYIRAAEQLMQSKYARQVGKRAERNANCLRTGEYKL